jgi:cell division protein FtsI (penicillin-binding protein 3)
MVKSLREKTVNDKYSHRFAEVPKRALHLFRAFFVFFIILIIWLIAVQVFYGPSGAAQAKANRTEHKEIFAHRGDIVDVSGNVLATSVDKYVIAIDQKVAANWTPIECNSKNAASCNQIDGAPVPLSGPLGLAKMLAPILQMSEAQLAYAIDGDSNYSIIAKDVDPAKERKIHDLNIDYMLNSKRVSTRVYPNGNIAGPEIGAATTDADGKINPSAGIELMMNDELAGVSGEYTYESGGQGERIPSTKSTLKDPVPGKTVKSTIDLDLQWKLQEALEKQVADDHADYGYMMVERVKTGDIVAISSSGSADAGSEEVASKGSAVFKGVFEPGSIVKPLTASGLIDKGIQTPESKFAVPNRYRTEYGEEIKDWREHGTEQLTLAGIIGYSYNTGTTMASKDFSHQDRYNLYRAYGLGEESGTDMPGESVGILHTPEYLDELGDARTPDTMLFGQGMAVNALQITNAYATIANGGVNPGPRIVSASRPVQANWQALPANDRAGRRVISEDAAKKTMQILESCVEKAVCTPAKIEDYRLGGKTGTAEVFGPRGLLYTVNSYVGVFPMDDPQYVVGVYITNPSSGIATTTATIPAFKDIAQFIIQKYAIRPSTPADYLPEVHW